jgi:hypothetical protein
MKFNKGVLKIINALCFLIAFLALMGAINKPSGYLADSLIYQGSLFGLCAAYLFNYWALQHDEQKTTLTISGVINVAVAALFLLGMSTKSAGGGVGYLLVIVQLLPLIGTPIYLGKKA